MARLIASNIRQTRSTSLWVVIALLAVLPLQAQPLLSESDRAPGAVCAPPVDDASAVASNDSVMEPSLRLIYGLTGLRQGSLEIRYRINGERRVAEIIDLATLELPMRVQAPAGKVDALHPRDGEREEGQRTIELLARHPDTVRALHQLSVTGVAIEVEILHSGRMRETISFAELVRRGTELRKRPIIALAAVSEVSGPGVVVRKPTLRARTEEYLPSCLDCTYDHPCDTECGYDPGKGGPQPLQRLVVVFERFALLLSERIRGREGQAQPVPSGARCLLPAYTRS